MILHIPYKFTACIISTMGLTRADYASTAINHVIGNHFDGALVKVVDNGIEEALFPFKNLDLLY